MPGFGHVINFLSIISQNVGRGLLLHLFFKASPLFLNDPRQKLQTTSVASWSVTFKSKFNGPIEKLDRPCHS